MALSNEYREWHLTRDGWVAGTDKHDFGIRGKEVEPPANRLLTIKCGVKMSSVFSGPEEYKHEVWKAEGQDKLIANLLEKYGDKEAGY